jgi:hypothetical protein
MHHEHEIDALLSQGEAGSIVDRLMALPRPAGTVRDNEWDRAVASRFQSHLVKQMRQVIGSGGSQQHAA